MKNYQLVQVSIMVSEGGLMPTQSEPIIPEQNKVTSTKISNNNLVDIPLKVQEYKLANSIGRKLTSTRVDPYYQITIYFTASLQFSCLLHGIYGFCFTF